MNIREKAAYVKGLLSGLDLDEDKKETKILKAVVDLMEDISESVVDLEDDVDEICDQLEVLDEDLADVEGEIFDDECNCNCDDDCDCDCHLDDNFYEVVCPSCDEKICLSEETLLDDKMDCPRCGELLEFDLSDVDSCKCGCDCDCDDDCECKPTCKCDENCNDDCECECHFRSNNDDK